MQIRSVLFVGRRNAARSIMAETCFNAASFIGWRAFSAGWETQLKIDRQTLDALRRQGFPVDALSSKPVDIFRQAGAPAIDLCVFLDTELPSDADDYPGTKEFWSVPDPSSAEGVRAYDEALDQVHARISGMILSGRFIHQGTGWQIAS